MPKVNKRKDLNKVKYVSMGDFYKNIDDIISLDGKLEYATRYILHHDMTTANDYPFEGVVNLARQKIAEVIARQKNPDKVSAKAKMFMANPAGYIKGEAQKLSKEISEADIKFEGDDALKANCDNIAKAMNDDFNTQVFEVDKVSKSIGFRANVEAKFGGKKQLEDNLKTAKSHKWYAIFSSSSQQWKDLEEAYKDYNNPNMKDEYCNDNFLFNKSVAYLQHKFPKWNPSQKFPANAFAKLNTSETAKVNFALNVMNTVKSQIGVDEKFHEVLDQNKDFNVKYEDLPEEHNVIDLDQVEFQNQISEDLDLENDSIVKQMDESMEIGVVNDEKNLNFKLPDID